MGKKLFLFAAAAVALASCTETDLSGDTSFAKESTSDAIQFSAKAGNAGTTRAGDPGTITTEILKANTSTGFSVMGYYTQTNDYAHTTLPNFMYNEQVTWDAAGYWTYDPVKYWPNGVDAANAANSPSNSAVEKDEQQKLSFFAYAPWVEVSSGSGTTPDYTNPTNVTLPSGGTARDLFYTAGTTADNLGNGIAAIKANNVAQDPEVYYYMPTATTAGAVDLLWGLRGSKVYNETDGTNNGNSTDALGDSYNVDLTKQVVPETVNFLFKHALSKIGGNTSSKTSTSGKQVSGFKVVLDVDGNGSGINGVDNQEQYLGKEFTNTKTLVTIKEVYFEDGKTAADATPKHAVAGTNSDLMNSGWFNLATGSWSSINKIDKTGTVQTSGATYSISASNEAASTYALNAKIAEPTTTVSKTNLAADGKTWSFTNSEPEGVTTTAKPIFADTKGDAANDVPALLLIPNGETAQTIYVTVDYIVRTADPQLSTGFSQVEQVITNSVSLKGLETNKYYTLVMHLGLTSVKFSAIVADWANSDDASYDEGGTTDGPTEASEEVWLPSNVVAINTTKASTPELGTSINDNVAANATTYTITLKDLKNGQTIRATKAGNAKTVKIGETDLTTTPYYTLTADAATTTVNVTLDPNTTLSPVSNKVIITQKSGDNTLSTTTVNIVQAAYNINLTETTGNVAVKDDEGNAVTSGLSVVVKDATTGAGLTSGDYSVSGGTITITPAGTYNVIVTYTSGTESITKTIKITKS